MVTYTCQRCFERKPKDRCHVNNFDELLCEDCEPNAWWDPAKKRSVTWDEVRAWEQTPSGARLIRRHRPFK